MEGTRANISHALTALVVLLMVAVPGVLTAVGSGGTRQDTTEDRTLAGRPQLPGSVASLRAWPHAFDSFMNDRLAGRDAAVRLNSRVLRATGSSPSPNVVLGTDGFLFLDGPAYENPIEDSTGRTAYTPAALAEAVRRLEGWRRWYAARGITYLVVLAPNKETVYRDRLPSSRREKPDSTISDQFVRAVAAHSEVDVVDLRAPLEHGRDSGLDTYLRTDTHWNEYGAAIAQEQVARQLATSHHAIHPTHFTASDFDLHRSEGGDLARLMAARDDLDERAPVRTPAADARLCSATRTVTGTALDFTCPTAPKLRALVYRDSFTTALLPYLASYFAYARYEQGHSGTQRTALDVDRYNPTVVIDELVERKLPWLPSPPPPTLPGESTS